MTGLVKVLIGTAVVAAVGTGIALAVHDNKRVMIDVSEQAVEKDEDGSVLKRIKRFVKRKTIKFLAWVALHMQEIESVSAVIGLASGAIGIASAVKDYRRKDDMQEQLNRIEDLLERHEIAECERGNHLGKYTETCAKVINDNIKQTDADIIKIGESMGLKMLEEGEEFSA